MATENAVLEGVDQTEFLERLALVLQAVKSGDLTMHIRPWSDPLCERVRVEANGLIAQLRNVLGEVNRIQSEVGVMGQLGPQADVAGAQGEFKRTLELVNQAAGNLTSQVRNFHRAAIAIEKGDGRFRADVPCHGELRQLRDTLNRVLEKLEPVNT